MKFSIKDLVSKWPNPQKTEEFTEEIWSHIYWRNP